MTAVPTNFLLAPEMIGFGISVAGVALADGQPEINAAIQRVRDAMKEFRLAFENGWTEIKTFSGSVEAGSDVQLRDSLDCLGITERVLAEGADMVNRVMKPKFQALVNAASDGAIFFDIQRFLGDMRGDYLPHIRRLRLMVIEEVYLRAERRGVENTNLPQDFNETLMSAPLDEVESWHETAYLMCDTGNLVTLVQSAHSDAQDMTNEYNSVAAIHRPAT
ncbi:MAG: hypothetical protein EXR07_07445 [Acetobacteraceae bacterium]|nr:hypothetical protein [Acetobacteraceae bacterium]